VKRRWWIAFVSVAVLAGGGWYAKEAVTQRMAEQLMDTVKDPNIQKQINEAMNNPQLTQSLKQAIGTSPAVGQQAFGEAQAKGKNGAGGTIGKATQEKSAQTTSEGSGQSTELAFANRDEAIRFAMSRFSATEIAQFASAYANRNNLSSADKARIKAEILSRFTPEEIDALRRASTK
jgi:hypothetical protein